MPTVAEVWLTWRKRNPWTGQTHQSRARPQHVAWDVRVGGETVTGTGIRTARL